MSKYFDSPSEKKAYKVTEDCCFEVTSYNEEAPYVTAKIDQDGDFLNSYDLLCYDCNPNLLLVPISQFNYNFKKSFVNNLRQSSGKSDLPN